MAGFTIPNYAQAIIIPGPDRAPQAQPDSLDFRIIAAAESLSGVLTGCQVTPSGPAAMTAEVAAGTVEVAGVAVAVGAQTVSFDPADADPRFDLVVVDNTGTASVVKGVAAADPAFPDLDPKVLIVLAAVLIEAGTVTITAARIVDKRMLRGLLTAVDISPTAGIDYGQLDLTGSIQVGDLAFDPATQTELNAVSLALSTHEALTTTAHGGIVSGTDPRLTDARIPTGPAGGVLSGAYPAPGFAVDMATQAELDSEATTRGAADTALAAPQYVTLATSATLANERVLVAGSGLSLTDGGAGGNATLDVNVDGSTLEISGDALRVKDGGITIAKLAFDPATQAELDAEASARAAADTLLASPQYVVLAATGVLANERVLTGTANQVILTDDGGGGNITLSLPQSINVGASPTFAGLTLSTFTLGSVLFAGVGGAVSQDNGHLFWNDTTNRLGIGDNSPDAAVDITPVAGDDGLYSRVSTTFNLISGGAPFYTVPAGTVGIDVDQWGNLWGGTNTLVTNRNPTTWNQQIPDFLWSANSLRLYTRSLVITEMGDPPDITRGRGGPNNSYPYNNGNGITGINTGQTIAIDRWRPWVVPFGGTPDVTVGGSLQADSAIMAVQTAEIPRDATGNGDYATGGRFLLGVTRLTRGVSSNAIAVLNTGDVLIGEDAITAATDGAKLTVQIDAGVNEVQTLTQSGTVSGGTFTLSFYPDFAGGAAQTTGALNFNATAGQVQTALRALAGIGSPNATVTGGPLPGTPLTITFSGTLAAAGLPRLKVNSSLTGGGTFATAITVVGRISQAALDPLRLVDATGTTVAKFSSAGLLGIGIGTATPGAAIQLGTTPTTPAGGIQFGSDVALYRSAADVLTTDDAVTVGGASVSLTNAAGLYLARSATNGTTQIFGSRAGSNSVDRFTINARGDFAWGPGNGAVDTTLFRSAADQLKTDDTLVVATSLGVTAAPSTNYKIDHVSADTDLTSGSYGMRIDRTFTITANGSNIYGAMDIYSRSGTDAFNQLYLQGAQFSVRPNKVGGSITNVQALSGTIVTGTGAGSASNVDALNFETDWFYTGTATNMRGTQILLVLKASGGSTDGSITAAYGARVQIANSATGASNTGTQGQIGTLAGFYAVAPSVGTASNAVAVVTSHGMLIENYGAAKITTSYGIRMSAQSGSTNTWALAIEGGNSYHVGNVFVGTTATIATARLHLAAGATGASSAPLKLNSGSLMSTAEAGAIEYSGNWYMTKNDGIRMGVGGTMFDFHTDAGNTTTTETNLYSSTTPANTLLVQDGKLRASYSGVTVAHATATRQFKLYFGGTAIFDSGALTINAAASWNIRVEIIRVSSSVVRYSVTMVVNGLTTEVYASVGELTGLTLGNVNVLKITGQAGGVGAATNDIVAKLGFVEFLAPATL